MKNILTTMLSIAIAVPAIAGNWSPVGDNIMSPWAEDVNPECPLPEYPRPQMVREQWMNLNGLWKYGITEAAKFNAFRNYVLANLTAMRLYGILSAQGRKAFAADVARVIKL